MTAPNSPPPPTTVPPEPVIHTITVTTVRYKGSPIVALLCSCGWWLGYGEMFPLDELAESGARHLAEVSR